MGVGPLGLEVSWGSEIERLTPLFGYDLLSLAGDWSDLRSPAEAPVPLGAQWLYAGRKVNIMRVWRLIGLVFLSLAFLGVAPAADEEKPPYVSSPRRLFTAPELLDAPEEWIERSLQWADAMFEQFPPSMTEHPVRRAALIRVDDVLHIESAPKKLLVQEFYRARLEKAVKEIEGTRVTKGMRIWKLYNHGFFVRTPTVSFTFDIVPGLRRVEKFRVDRELLMRIAEQSDATFISHYHGDHASQEVARIFLERNKPVVAVEGLWPDEEELAGKLTVPERSTTMVHEIPVRNGKQVLKVVAYPGHQGEPILVNVHLVTTPEGFTVVHTGDQSGSEDPGGDFDWIAHIGAQHDVDVLMPNCWTTNIQRMIRGVNPQLVITGHENEMGHTVDHREDYTQTYNHLFGSRTPYIVMAWGEAFHYEGPER